MILEKIPKKSFLSFSGSFFGAFSSLFHPPGDPEKRSQEERGRREGGGGGGKIFPPDIFCVELLISILPTWKQLKLAMSSIIFSRTYFKRIYARKWISSEACLYHEDDVPPPELPRPSPARTPLRPRLKSSITLHRIWDRVNPRTLATCDGRFITATELFNRSTEMAVVCRFRARQCASRKLGNRVKHPQKMVQPLHLWTREIFLQRQLIRATYISRYKFTHTPDVYSKPIRQAETKIYPFYTHIISPWPCCNSAKRKNKWIDAHTRQIFRVK